MRITDKGNCVFSWRALQSALISIAQSFPVRKQFEAPAVVVIQSFVDSINHGLLRIIHSRSVSVMIHDRVSGGADDSHHAEETSRLVPAEPSPPEPWLHEVVGDSRHDDRKHNAPNPHLKLRHLPSHNPGKREERPVPDVEGIADKPEPDHYPVRKEISVEERVFPRSYHEHSSHDREKRLVPRKVLTVEGKYSSEYQREPDSRQDVPAEPPVINPCGIPQQHSREIRPSPLRDTPEHLPLIELQPGKDTSGHQLPEPEKRRVERGGWIPLHRVQLKAKGCQSSHQRKREDVEVELIGYEEHKRPDEIELLLYAQGPKMKQRLRL